MSRFALVLLFLPIFALPAREVVPLGIGIFPGILSPAGTEQSVMGLRINPLVGIHRNVDGLDVGVANVALGNTRALQLGIFNYQRQRMAILALQTGVLANWNAGHTSGFGLQVAGLFNRNAGNGYFFGIQVAPGNHSPRNHLYGASLGLYNRNGYLRGVQIGILSRASDLGGLQWGISAQSDQIWGIQCGLLSRARRALGFQIGLVNVAERVSGFQLGLVNRAGSLRGIQIGLINIHTGGKVPLFPLINVGF